MSLSTITKTAPQNHQSRLVYEYSFTVHNSEDNDTRELIAAFVGVPSTKDWQQWLAGWNSCDYFLVASPNLVRTI